MIGADEVVMNFFFSSDICETMLFKVHYAGKKRYIKLNGASYSTFLRQGNIFWFIQVDPVKNYTLFKKNCNLFCIEVNLQEY